MNSPYRSPALLPPIAVTPGAYTSVAIQGMATMTWISINEIALITAGCPADSD